MKLIFLGVPREMEVQDRSDRIAEKPKRPSPKRLAVPLAAHTSRLRNAARYHRQNRLVPTA